MNWLTIHVFKRQQHDKAAKNASISQLENLWNTWSWYNTTPFSFPLSSQCYKRSKSGQLYWTETENSTNDTYKHTTAVSVPRVLGTKQKLRIISSTAAVRLNCIFNLAPVSCRSAKMAAFWYCFGWSSLIFASSSSLKTTDYRENETILHLKCRCSVKMR